MFNTIYEKNTKTNGVDWILFELVITSNVYQHNLILACKIETKYRYETYISSGAVIESLCVLSTLRLTLAKNANALNDIEIK